MPDIIPTPGVGNFGTGLGQSKKGAKKWTPYYYLRDFKYVLYL